MGPAVLSVLPELKVLGPWSPDLGYNPWLFFAQEQLLIGPWGDHLTQGQTVPTLTLT